MKKGSIFWIGYSDLMTSLFFVMLVLFGATVGLLNIEISKSKLEKEKLATINELQIEISKSKLEKENLEQKLDKINELQKAVQELPKDYFEYQIKYKRFKLKRQIQFEKQKATINEKDHAYLIAVGESIQKLVRALQEKDELKGLDIKYLVVIEGMASKDNYTRNFELSYERALSLYRLWEAQDIVFNASNCEVQISGSGSDGIREYSGSREYMNQQFLIHIIPKMGQIDESK